MAKIGGLEFPKRVGEDQYSEIRVVGLAVEWIVCSTTLLFDDVEERKKKKKRFGDQPFMDFNERTGSYILASLRSLSPHCKYTSSLIYSLYLRIRQFRIAPFGQPQCSLMRHGHAREQVPEKREPD